MTASTASTLTADLAALVSTLVAAAMSNASPNALYSVVLAYYPPGPWGTPPVPWPASVDVQPLPGYTKFRETLAEATDVGEVVLKPVPGGFLCAGAYKPVFRVPIDWPGTPSLTTTEPLFPGITGWLHLFGKNQGLTLSTGAPDIPEMQSNPLRLSDSRFSPTFLSGVMSLASGPSGQPQVGAFPQIGARDVTSETVFIRNTYVGWVLAGLVQLGFTGVPLPINRTGDSLIPDLSLVTTLTNIIAGLATLGVEVAPWGGTLGVTGPGSTTNTAT